ncbi:uncharacterized protein ARMOST_04656 [Armillaria ostoyae]|uniref:Uncharacterized protein n=1 Tax=Armillaria ostoyae TaxID=47428 RepID=A0A284QXX4_ARMOS|nr:uncharacterized protein ARMOST_04656 [Armillaria ostoyae]
MYCVKYHGITPTTDLDVPNADMPTDKKVSAWNAVCKEEEKGLTVDKLAVKQASEQEEFSNLRRSIIAWFNWCFKGVQQSGSFACAIEATIQQGKKPCHARFLNAYTEMYYPSKIKLIIDAAFAQSTNQSEKAGFTLTNCTIKEHWDWEPESVKTMIHNKIEAQYQDAMAKYKKLQAGLTDKSPEDYHLALTQGSNFVQVIINSLKERFRMQMCIMLVGPIGENRDAIEVRSIHSGIAMGLQWPEVDKKGFTIVEKSFLHFGLKSFKERNARALKGTIISEEDAALAPVALLSPLQLVKKAPISDISDRSLLPSLPSEVLKSSTAKSSCPSSNKTVEPSTEKSPSSNEALKSSTGSPPVPAPSSSVVSIISSKDKTDKGHSIDDATFEHSGSPSPTRNNFTAPEAGDGDSGVSRPSLEVDLPNEREKSSTPIQPKDVEAAWDATNCNEWYPELTSAFDRFRHGALWDPLWSRAVDSFLVFEWQQGFATKGKVLCVRDQPACIHAFMKEHHYWGKPRDLENLKEFNKQWWAWWGVLQLVGQGVAGFMFAQSEDLLDWEGLEKCSGCMGFILLLGSLLWWGETAHAIGEKSEDWWNWHLAIKNFVWVIEHIIRTADLGDGV